MGYVGLLAFVILAQVGPGSAIVTPPQPGNVTVQNNVTLEAPKPDPQAIADASVTSFQAIVTQLVLPTLTSWVNDLLSVPEFVRTTPADLTYTNGAVLTMQRFVLTAAGALLVLAIIGYAMALMLGQRPSPGRLVLGAVLSLTEMVWWELGIRLNNAITGEIAAPSTADIIRPHLTPPELSADPVKAFAPGVLVIVYAVVALMLLLSLGFRLALIDVLIVVGPLGLLCGSLEQTRGFYSRYLTLSAGTLFSQILVVVCLKLAPILGALGSGIAGALLGIMVLLLARKMPTMLARGHADGRGGGGLMRLMVLRRFLPI